MKKTIALSAISAMALTGLAYSQDDASISTDLAVSYNTEYIFRGFNLGDDLYTAGVDLAGSDFCGLDWSVGVWYGNWNAGRGDVSIPVVNAAGVPTGDSIEGFNVGFPDEELDIYGSLGKDFGAFNVSSGIHSLHLY